MWLVAVVGALRCRMRTVLNMFRASLCPSSGEQRPCVTAFGVSFCNRRENVDISRDVILVWQCVVNLVGASCGHANVVCKWVSRGVGLVSASYVFHVWCIGGGGGV